MVAQTQKKIALFIIDPQVDFCDPKGSLYVNGADKDMDRLAKMVNTYSQFLADIQLTLDSHHRASIFFRISWVDKNGNHPGPYEQITHADVLSGKWQARNPLLQNRFREYTAQLESNGRYTLMIWPDHCLIGDPGHCIYPSIRNAVFAWEEQYCVAGKTTKGSNVFTEHYSVFKSDVPDPKDASTGMNKNLVEVFDGMDDILFAGEALSHCVASSGRDFADALGDNIKKVVLLEDATSPVGGPLAHVWKQKGEQFIQDMLKLGMRLSTTDKYFKTALS